MATDYSISSNQGIRTIFSVENHHLIQCTWLFLKRMLTVQ